MRKNLGLALTLLISFGFVSPAAAAPQKITDNLQLVAAEKVEVYLCSSSPRTAELHYRFDRSWIRLAKSKVIRDGNYCKDKNLPIKHSFSFTVPVIYQSIEPAAKYAKMLLRVIGPKQPHKLFTATVYSTQAEKTAATGSTQAASQLTDWNKCLYKGQLMTGRVKVVSFDANFRVQLVQHNADLLVQEAKGRPIGCGSWQFVNQNYDFSIQLVTELPDFTIEIVKHRGNRP